MVMRLYATTYPRKIAGLVSIDAQNEDFADAYKELLTPEVYVASVLNPGPLPGLESYSAVERLDLPVSAAQMRQAQADTPLRQMPLVVLSHSRDLPNPFGFPPGWPIEALERVFQDSQDKLAELVPGARHVIATTSGHYIQLDQPELVTREIRRVVRAARSRGGTPVSDTDRVFRQLHSLCQHAGPARCALAGPLAPLTRRRGQLPLTTDIVTFRRDAIG